MRTRNREVNIFNMSLLDILTGMLGAFLFLMLGLVPYYMKVNSQQGQSSSQSKRLNTQLILLLAAHWNSSAKLNLFLYGPSNGLNHLGKKDVWFGPNDPLLPPGEPEVGPDPAGFGYASESALPQLNDHYLVVGEVLSPAANSGSLDPKLYSHLGFTMNLCRMDDHGAPGTNYDFSYSSNPVCFVANASQAKPGVLYGLFSVTVIQDPTKKYYNLESAYCKGHDSLPPNVVPLPGITDPFPPEPNNHPLAGVGLEVSSDVTNTQASASDLLVDHLIVKSVVPGGPGEKAGVQAGDEIPQINGTKVAGAKFEDVTEDWLRGKEGSPVQLTVIRKGEASPLSFTLIRAKIPGEANH